MTIFEFVATQQWSFMDTYHLMQMDNSHPNSVGYIICFELLNE